MSDPFVFSMDVLGENEVRDLFNRAGSTVRDQVRAQMLSIGEQLVNAARARAPQLTGKLERSIKPRLTETDSALGLSVKPSARYGFFVEFGTAPHATGSLAEAVSKNIKGYARTFRRKQAKALRESGTFRTKPEPFMGPAWDSLAGQIQAQLQAAIGRGVAAAGG